jgi:hypothetical protein
MLMDKGTRREKHLKPPAFKSASMSSICDIVTFAAANCNKNYLLAMPISFIKPQNFNTSKGARQDIQTRNITGDGLIPTDAKAADELSCSPSDVGSSAVATFLSSSPANLLAPRPFGTLEGAATFT